MLIPQFWLGAGAMLAAEMVLLFLAVLIIAVVRACRESGPEDRQNGHSQTGNEQTGKQKENSGLVPFKEFDSMFNGHGKQ